MEHNLAFIFFFSLIFFSGCSHSPKVLPPTESPRLDSRQISPSLSKEEAYKADFSQIDAHSKENERQKTLFLAKMKSSSALDVDETLSQESLKIMKEVIYLDPTINLWGTNSELLISKLEKAIEFDPLYHAAYYFLGMSYRKNSLLEKSLMSLQKAIELKPNYPETYIQIAKTYEAAGRGKDAISSYKQGIARGTDDAYWAYYEMALILWNEGSISEAEKNLKHAVNLKKDFGIAYYYLGLVSVEQNKYKEALEYFQKTNLIFFPDALYSKGVFLLKNAMEKNPENREILASLGLIHYKKGKYNESILILEKLKAVDAARFSNYLELGISYYRAGEYKESKINLIMAKKSAPESFEAHLYLGLSFKFDVKERDYNRALTELYKAVEIRPNSFLALYNLADIYFGKNDYDSSLIYLKKAYSINPNHANTLSKMGEVYHKRKDYDKAIKYFNKSLETEESLFAYSALAKVYTDMEQYDTAIDLYQKANALGEFDLFEEDIAALFFKRKDYAGGINILKKYLAKYPKINSARFSLAVAFSKTGEVEESKQAYKIILDNDPKYFAAHFNLAVIYENENNLESLKKAKEHFTISSAGFPEEARKAIEECEFKINLKEFPKRMNSLSKSSKDVGLIASFLLCAEEYSKGNKFFIDGVKEASANFEKLSHSGESIITSDDVSPSIYEAQGIFKKLLRELVEIKKRFQRHQGMTEKFIRAAENRIEGIEIYAKGYYFQKEDYRGEWEKGERLINLADGFFCEILREISNLMVAFPNDFNKFDIRIVNGQIEYFENMPK